MVGGSKGREYLPALLAEPAVRIEAGQVIDTHAGVGVQLVFRGIVLYARPRGTNCPVSDVHVYVCSSSRSSIHVATRAGGQAWPRVVYNRAFI